MEYVPDNSVFTNEAIFKVRFLIQLWKGQQNINESVAFKCFSGHGSPREDPPIRTRLDRQKYRLYESQIIQHLMNLCAKYACSNNATSSGQFVTDYEFGALILKRIDIVKRAEMNRRIAELPAERPDEMDAERFRKVANECGFHLYKTVSLTLVLARVPLILAENQSETQWKILVVKKTGVRKYKDWFWANFEYVGIQMIEPYMSHQQTVSAIQQLPSARFASEKHAICHVLKHGIALDCETWTSKDALAYFEKAQEVILWCKDYLECVSSEWTQMGGA
uniref:Uncharacterized protein n=1 Tax=Plectus sambesii TaxID=2011161 RepID=A0A914XLP6_9BILA